MSSEKLAHPVKAQLIAFGQGRLAADESSQVEQHLESCRECCETLLDLKDDTFVGLVKIAEASTPDRGMAAPGRPAVAPLVCRENETRTAGGGHPTDSEHAATVLVQSGESIRSDELPPELVDHPRYRIVELIGRGGMGNVYRAEHRLMNRAVAIKLINSQLMQHPHAVERFRREVQAAAKLSHPNIVAAYDAEQAGNAHFLVMEFVEGTDLASVVKHRGPMSVTEACECIRQAAAGLQHAHEKGMVHRDIKPHNLMLAAGGQVRILDFGLAGFAEAAVSGPTKINPKRERGRGLQNDPETESSGAPALADASGYMATAAHLTTMGSVMGTPDYMAPEQAVDAHSADIRADIYSLGCTLHFLLTGKPPFEADNVLAKLKAHAESERPSLAALRNDVPSELSKLAAKMLAKNPADRFQSPAAVADALGPFAQTKVERPRRRRRTLVAAALFGLIGLLAGVIYVATDNGQFIIEPADDQVAVMVGDKGIKIRDAALNREYRVQLGKKSIRTGEYEIDVTELPSGLEFSPSKTFRLTRGGVARVTVSFKPATQIAMDANVPTEDSKQTAAVQAALAWMKLVDEGKFDECWNASARFARASGTKEQLAEPYRVIREKLGVPRNRRRRSVNSFAQLAGTPPGESIIVQFETEYSIGGKQLEQVTLYWDQDRQWRAAGCHISPAPSDLTTKTQPGADIALPPANAVALFDRWVGVWDATFEVKPNAQTPEDRNSRGTMTTRKVLSDRFLLTHSANDSDPTQWLWFLTHDANFAAYRIWIFGNGGEAFERRGQWDAASQMLTLQLVPPSPGVTGQSTDRFIGNDRIESTLFVKSAEGQVTRDNRWSAKKKTLQPEKLPEVPTTAAHAPLPEELSLLNKFAGDWTIHAKSKPSVWLPNGGEETLTEKVAWILGGRFLMARTLNEKDELTSMWIATYEPAEKSNRFWFFNADGSSGQWRVTWDASSRGFHWRSIDMPTGWIGTGFNRWINDDTFDNQALIKDDTGRVLLDGTQEKRRKK